MARWALIADDLTGALDTALQFRKVGLRTLVSARPCTWPDDEEVIAISTEARRADPAAAKRRVSDAIQDLWFAQPQHVYKKTDSLLRGNIGPELEALVDTSGVDAIIYTPAYPTGGRTTIGGVHHLWGTRVDKGPPSRDPVAPVREAHVPTLIQSTSNLSAKEVPLEHVRAGVDQLAQAFSAGREAGIRILVPDVESDDDLATVAAAMELAGFHRVCAGSAGLAENLARGSQVPETASVGTPRARSVAAIVGTPNEHTQKQVAHAEATLSIEHIALAGGGADVEAGIRRARQAWRAGRYVLFDVVIASPNPSPEQERRQRELVAELAARLQRDVQDLGLILTGGDTALAVFQGMETETVGLHGEVEWGVPFGVTTRGGVRGIPVITKGGTMGSEAALTNAYRRLGPHIGPAARPATRRHLDH